MISKMIILSQERHVYTHTPEPKYFVNSKTIGGMESFGALFATIGNNVPMVEVCNVHKATRRGKTTGNQNDKAVQRISSRTYSEYDEEAA